MPSTINAQTTPFAAIVQEADNTGNLAFQTANVTALTLDTNQNATFANVVTATTLVGSANASSLTTGTVPTARLATGTANSSTFLRGDQTWTAVTQTRISGGTTGLTPNTLTSGDVTLAGTLAVANGGTGATTLTANNVLLGNGTSALQAVAPGTSGNVLTSNGTTWQSTALPAGGVTSLNGQTGAITNTDLYAIGSYVIGRPFNRTNYTVNVTIAGTSLVTVPGYAFVNNSNNWGDSFGQGNNNTGQVTVNTGTWRCVSPAFGFNNGTNSAGVPGLWVRIS